MKGQFGILIILLTCLLACKTRPYFVEAEGNLEENLRNVQLHSKLKNYTEGCYCFDVCAKAISYNEFTVLWYSDCNDTTSDYSILERLCIVFIDEVRAYYFKQTQIQENEKTIDLDRVKIKFKKLGIYRPYITNSANAEKLFVRLRDPKVSDTINNYADLFFKLENEKLILEEMVYFDGNSNLRDALEKSVISSTNIELIEHFSPDSIGSQNDTLITGLLSDSPQTSSDDELIKLLSVNPETMKVTLRPKDILYVDELAYKFIPMKFKLRINKENIDSIKYEATNSDSTEFIRKYYQKEKIVKEELSDKSTIITW